MNEALHFYWPDDDTLQICDANGTELERIVLSELPERIPGFSIGKCEGKECYHMEHNREPAFATKKEIEAGIASYFRTHDIRNYNVCDLWYDVMCDNLCGFGG